MFYRAILKEDSTTVQVLTTDDDSKLRHFMAEYLPPVWNSIAQTAAMMRVANANGLDHRHWPGSKGTMYLTLETVDSE